MIIYRQHPETGMVQRVHADGSHHLPSFDPRCADETCEQATCIETASCEEGDHTYTWPCDLAPMPDGET